MSQLPPYQSLSTHSSATTTAAPAPASSVSPPRAFGNGSSSGAVGAPSGSALVRDDDISSISSYASEFNDNRPNDTATTLHHPPPQVAVAGSSGGAMATSPANPPPQLSQQMYYPPQQQQQQQQPPLPPYSYHNHPQPPVPPPGIGNSASPEVRNNSSNPHSLVSPTSTGIAAAAPGVMASGTGPGAVARPNDYNPFLPTSNAATPSSTAAATNAGATPNPPRQQQQQQQQSLAGRSMMSSANSPTANPTSDSYNIQPSSQPTSSPVSGPSTTALSPQWDISNPRPYPTATTAANTNPGHASQNLIDAMSTMSLSNPKPGETKGGYTAPQQQQQQQQQQPPPYTAHPASSPPPSSQPQVFATGYGPSYAKPPPPQRIASQGPYSSGLGPDISPPAYSYSVPPIPSPLIGPTLQFQGVDIATAAWLGSILILTRSSATQPAEVISTTAGLGVGQQRQQQPGYGYSYSNTSTNNAINPATSSPNPNITTTTTTTTTSKPPIIQVWDDGIHGPGEGKPKEFFGKPIYYNPYSGYTFWRADISIPLHLEAEKWIQYQILWDESPHGYAMDFANGMAIGGSRRTYDFRVPSQKGPWRFCAFGNTEVTNKLNTPVYGSNQPHCRSPLWDDLEAKHRKLPFHLMLGTGGQINGEAVWDECQAVLRPFFRHQNPTDIASAANKFSWTEDMERAVDQFYFNRYLQVWFPPVSVPHENSLGMCDLLAHIPYSFVIDDADIFSCFGSHQDSVQRSVVVSNIGRIAVKYWCLFQAHTTQNLAIQHNFIGKGYNWLKQLGPFTAVLGLDSRTERSQREIISNASYTSILNAVEQRLCEYTKHLIVVVPNPVIFPHTQLVESVVSGADSIGMLSIANTLMDKFAGGPSDPKRKLAIRAENRFGRRDFLVKLNDQWTSSAHLNERNRFVQRLQDLSRRRSLRITFVSGHVNFGGCGCLQSYSGQGLDANSIDWRLMEQLIIAGMVDTPVDSATLYAYYRSSGRRQFDPYTLEKFYRTFEHDPQLLLPFGVGGGGGRVEGGNNGGSSSSGAGSSNKKFIARRCYMTFMELPVSGQPDPSLLSLKAHMHVEVPGMRLGGARSIEIDVPPLVAPSSIPAPPMQPYHYSPPPVSAPSGSGVFGNMRPPLQAAGATAGYPSTLSNSSGGNAVQQPPPSYLPQYGYHYGGGTRGFNDGKNEPPLIYSSDEDEGSHLGSPPGTYGSGGSGGNPPYSYSGVRSQHNPAEGGANPPPYSMR